MMENKFSLDVYVQFLMLITFDTKKDPISGPAQQPRPTHRPEKYTLKPIEKILLDLLESSF